MNRLPGASLPAQRITPHTASPVRYWLTPSHTTMAGRVASKPAARSNWSKSSFSKSTLTKVTLRQIGMRRSQPLLLHRGGVGMIHFEDARGCQRIQAPRPRIEAGAEQHDLIDAHQPPARSSRRSAWCARCPRCGRRASGDRYRHSTAPPPAANRKAWRRAEARREAALPPADRQRRARLALWHVRRHERRP